LIGLRWFGEDDVNATNRTLKQKIYQEMKEYFVIASYLWVVFAMLVIYKSVILAEQKIDFEPQGFAIINALALAKVIVVARKLHLADQLKDAPLIYPTLLKSASFSILLAGFKVLEEAAVGMYHGKSFHESISDLGGGSGKAIVSMVVLLFVLLIPFFGFTELRRVFGEGTLEDVFLRPPHFLKLPHKET
jgi:hypothetical protein